MNVNDSFLRDGRLMKPHYGKNNKIGRNLMVSDDFCYIGNNCKLGDNVTLGFGTFVGDDCVIGSNTRIGEFTVLNSFTFIGEWCSIGAMCTSQGRNVIGSYVLINNQCQIGEGMIIEDRVFMGPKFVPSNTKVIQFNRMSDAIVTPSRIKFGARIGSGVTLLPNVTIGREALIGAGSVVTKDIPDFMTAYGNPAKPVKEVPLEDRLPEKMFNEYKERVSKKGHMKYSIRRSLLNSVIIVGRRILKYFLNQ